MKSPTVPHSIGSSVGLAAGLLLCLALVLPLAPAQSREGDRTLRLFFGHTGERGEFTFKRNGRYDRKELNRINTFLRDWRKGESTRIDPHLLDLVWEVYRESGARDDIHVVSAYRSPKTNAMLRKRSSGVAKNSQHIRGKAMDFFIPDVPLKKLRALAMKKQGGGVGYYPSSGSPFVHLDTGSVRAWPRMSRKQLIALFPNGETLHLPSDGKPLPGYERAVARLQSAPASTSLAYLEADEEPSTANANSSAGMKAWLKRVFPGEDEDEAATPQSAPAAGGEQLVASLGDTAAAGIVVDDDLLARRPRARPWSATELAAADALPQPATVSPADSKSLAAMAYAPLRRARPDPAFLAASLQDHRSAGAPLPVGNDMVAALGVQSQGQSPGQPQGTYTARATGDPVDLAFAALDGGIASPSAEDRAAIAAFAAVRAGSAPGRPLALAAATPARVAAPQPAANSGTGGAATGGATGVVLAPDWAPSYGADQDAIQGLIASPATYDPQFAQLAMPVPSDDATSSIYRAPQAATDVSDLSNERNLPVDRFEVAKTAPQDDERGFFMRLFASLIE